jgi:formylglycine-generating enzyme required for sulfatase activity
MARALGRRSYPVGDGQDPRMPEQVREHLMRVRDPKDGVHGAAFLVGPRTVVTCAHVIARALGLPDDQPDKPDGGVELDFPRLPDDPRVSARVVGWRGMREAGGDIAVLELESDPPAGAGPARLMREATVWHHAFHAFGFPENFDDGVIATGELLGALGQGWVQMDQHHDTTHRVEGGFSGAPVFDEVLNGVVGMAVEADLQPDVRSAYMLPTALLFATWPALAERSIVANPYRSLRAFSEDDAAIFFGREAFVRDRLLPAADRNALVAVIVGASGCGKSSVVFAGLLPALRDGGGWTIGQFRLRDEPFHALAAPLMDFLEPRLSEVDRLAETRKLGERLTKGEITLSDVVERLENARPPDGRRYLIVADEFEKLFSLTPGDEVQRRFLDELAKVIATQRDRATPLLTVVLAIRVDFLKPALEHRAFAGVLQDSTHFLGAMTHDELENAIERPAAAFDVQFEDGLVERLITDVGTDPGRLPLLQFALTLLWSEQSDGWIRHKAYEDIGEVEGALAAYAEDVVNRMSTEDQEIARRLFVQLVQPGPGADTRHVARQSELGPGQWELAQQLSYDRLVIIGRDERDGSETVELIHDTLIGFWERLRTWVDEAREFRAWQERFRRQVDQWNEIGKGDAELLPGYAIAQAEEWLKTRPDDFGPEDHELIEASQAHRDRAALAREKARRRQLLASWLVAAVAIVLVVAFYALGTAAAKFDPIAYLAGPQQIRGENPMVPIAGGPMVFGSDQAIVEAGEQPTQRIEVPPFSIQRHEVTNAEYRVCRLAGACSDPILPTAWQDRSYDAYPVVEITAWQATDFCEWLGANLPDTYQWERAARGSDGRSWPWGEDPPDAEHANFFPSDGLRPAGQLIRGATLDTGILDLSGNASEWTRTTTVDDGDGAWSLGEWDGKAADALLVIRGWGWVDEAGPITVVNPADPSHYGDAVGFRCAEPAR